MNSSLELPAIPAESYGQRFDAKLGVALLGDSLSVLRTMPENSVNLVVIS